jgi:3-(3-hydroxy-phenyl)propionate hydroxylase
MERHIHDLLIVGVGPVGAAAANIAGSLGLDCVAIDPSDDVYALPRAIHFDADIMRVFQSAGLAAEIEGHTRAATGSLHRGADGDPIRDFRVSGEPGDLGWRPHYMFFQPTLDALLRARAAARPGVDVRTGWTATGLEDDGEAVTVSLLGADGATDALAARHVLACDGASSTVRRLLGITLSDFGFEEPWIIVDVRVPDAGLGPDHMEMYCDPRRPGTYVPGPDTHRRWEFMLLPGEDGEALRTPEGLRSLIQPVTPWVDVDDLEILRSAIYRFHGLVAERWASGRISLAGDAVHQTPPFYAQGMCHGIRDVRNVIWKLAHVLDGRAAPALLQTYQPEREPHVRAIIGASIANGRYICELDPAAAARRDEDFRARLRAGADVGSFRALIPGLQDGLLDGPVAASGPVGQMLPQPRVVVDGREVLLDELLGPGFALLTRARPAAGEALDWFCDELRGRAVDAADFDEPEALLHRWFDEAGCDAVVVRPDRYVFGTATGDAALTGLLGRLREALGAGVPARGPEVAG